MALSRDDYIMDCWPERSVYRPGEEVRLCIQTGISDGETVTSKQDAPVFRISVWQLHTLIHETETADVQPFVVVSLGSFRAT